MGWTGWAGWIGLDRRRTVAVLGVAVAAAGLAGCSRPVPEVALFANGSTVRSEASVYCFEGQSIEADSCSVAQVEPPVTRIRTLDTIGIDVPTSIAKGGYVVELGGRRAGPVQTSTWYSVPLSLPEGQEAPVRVVALTAPDDSAQVRGIWRFDLVSGSGE